MRFPTKKSGEFQFNRNFNKKLRHCQSPLPSSTSEAITTKLNHPMNIRWYHLTCWLNIHQQFSATFWASVDVAKFHEWTMVARSSVRYPTFSHSIDFFRKLNSTIQLGRRYRMRSLKTFFIFYKRYKLDISLFRHSSPFTWKSNVHELIKLCRCWVNRYVFWER